MRSRIAPLLLLCLIRIAVLIAGCTTQPGGPVTTPPTMLPATTPPPAHTAPPTEIGTGTPGTIRTTGTPSMSPTEDRGVRAKITAKNFAFDLSTITVPAGSQVVVEFENEDQAPHNVAFYTTPSLTTIIYKGEIITGPSKITYTFTAPSTPGTYYFRCDVHPSMQGQFIVT